MTERTLQTPLGRVTIEASDGAITALHWRAGRRDPDGLLEMAEAQLDEYFTGSRAAFDLPLAPTGSELVRRVCAEIRAIPFGQTRSYGDLAKTLDVPPQA